MNALATILTALVVSLISPAGSIDQARSGRAYGEETCRSAGRKTDTLGVTVYFRIGSYAYEEGINGNAAHMQEFLDGFRKNVVEKEYVIDSILVTGFASPDGKYTVNQRLSAKRTLTVKSLIQERLGLPDSLFTMRSLGIDWEGTVQALRTHTEIPDREEMLRIIEATPEITCNSAGKLSEDRRFALGNLNDGRGWSYLFTNIFPDLRTGSAEVILIMHRDIPEASLPLIEAPKEAAQMERSLALHDPALMPGLAGCKGKATESCSEDGAAAEKTGTKNGAGKSAAGRGGIAPFAAVKTNMLHDAAAIPSLGAEFCIGNSFSVAGEWSYSWWKSDSRHWWWQTYGGDASLRYWLGRRSVEKRLTGHHIGIYGQMNTFDFEAGKRGLHSPDWNYAAGVEYGFSLPAGRYLNVDFTIGAGYIHGSFNEYIPLDGHYVWQATRPLPPFCVSKAEISLVWLIGRDRAGKGGAR